MIQELKKSWAINSERNAFCINDQYYTYKQLATLVQNICFEIELLGGSKTKKVGIITTNSIETYASIFSCWFLGFAYVPLNPKIPKERNAMISKTSEIDLVLSSENNSGVINEENNSFFCTKDLYKEFNKEFEYQELKDDSLMYILFTSGSTGEPKGVPINYKNLKTFLDSYNSLGFSYNAEDRFLQMFDLTFDVSVVSYLAPLLIGACVFTVPSEGIKYMSVFKILRNYKITFASIVPSIINYLKPFFHEIELPFLKYCILTAEASNIEVVKQWISCIPNSEVINLYGPTEATIWCASYVLDVTNIKSYNEMLAIGKPFKNVVTLILDDYGNVLENGIKGEFCVSSNQLTSGYLNNNERNTQSFFIKNDKRFYKTGDLCYLDEEGDVYYCGRIDQQVKIQGFRIELSEIESVTRELFGINNIAIRYKNKMGVDQIALFVEKYNGETSIINKGLQTKLPYYMVPSLISLINEFPHNNSGKVDRVKLASLVIG